MRSCRHTSAKYGGVINQLWGGHQPTMGGPSAKYGGGHQPTMGGASAKYGGGHQPTMGGHQPSMGGSSTDYGGAPISQVWGGGVFSHQYVQEVKIERIILATHTSCRL